MLGRSIDHRKQQTGGNEGAEMAKPASSRGADASKPAALETLVQRIRSKIDPATEVRVYISVLLAVSFSVASVA